MFSNLKHTLILVGVAILLAGGGFAAGRFATPPRTVVTEKTVVQIVEKQVVVTQTKTEVQIVKVKDVAKNVAVDTHIVKNKDGSETIDTHTRDLSQTKTTVDANTSKVTNTTATKDLSEKIDQSKVTVTTYAKPNWSLSLQPGFDIAGALGKGDPYSIFPGAVNGLSLKHVVLGVSVDHRLFGPLHTGIWANSAGAGGLILRLEF
jgi:hypothetical protein